MLTTTLSRLRCPSCDGRLSVLQGLPLPQHEKTSAPPKEIRSGTLRCQSCPRKFPILAGVALIVKDSFEYLLTHVKGISKVVPDTEIPTEIRKEFRQAKKELEAEHIEEDLEAERVNALYLMNHYLNTQTPAAWWKPTPSGPSSSRPSSLLPPPLLIDQLIQTHWDQGPFTHIRDWMTKMSQTEEFSQVLELGCGVGGLRSILQPFCQFYLGVDSSFASIALARHLNLGIPYPHSLRFPGDLLQGSVSRKIKIPVPSFFDGRSDFIVSDAQAPGICENWNLTLSLNMIDMLDRPQDLPRLQHRLLAPGGLAIQSCPYIWHDSVARKLRKYINENEKDHPKPQDSASAVEWLYQHAGFRVEASRDQIPWLFFKHYRQLEIYSVHLFSARKR